MKHVYQLISFAAFFCLPAFAMAQPCSGTPVAGSISPSSFSVCPGTPVTLTLSGYTQGAGITIQWNEGPSGVGVWTPIPGATNDVFTTTPSSSTDFFAVVACSNGGGTDVSNAATVTVSCPTADSVWPGDADYNYTVDNYDPLSIAVAFGGTGTPRAGATINWQAEASADWADTFATGLNYKHADCNGDGIIDNNDLTAITNNFGLSHIKGYSQNTYKTTAFPDLYFDMSGVTLTPGTTVSIPLKFGTANVPANNIYGVAGTAIIQGMSPAGTPAIAIDPAWFGTGVSTLEFSKATNPNTVMWAFARTDHQNGSGNGTIGNLSLTIPASASGQMVLHLQDIKLIDMDGAELTDYNVVDDTTFIAAVGISSANEAIQSCKVVPNPSTSMASLEITTNAAIALGVRLTDITGREAWAKQVAPMTGLQSIQLPAQALPAGMYFIRLTDGTGQVSPTLKWIKQ